MLKSSTEYWTTRDGRKLKPSQMETSHLLNTLRFVRHKVARRCALEARRESDLALSALSYASGAPDGAAMAAEAASDEFLTRSQQFTLMARRPDLCLQNARRVPIVNKIYLEAKRRGVSESSMLKDDPIMELRRRVKRRRTKG